MEKQGLWPVTPIKVVSVTALSYPVGRVLAAFAPRDLLAYHTPPTFDSG